jgi:hypothetical protein
MQAPLLGDMTFGLVLAFFISEADEANIALVPGPGKVQEVFHAPAQTVQLPRHQRIAIAQSVQCLVQTRAPGLGAG